MKLTTLIVATVMAAGPALAEDVTFVIPGGTKGVYMGQAVSYTEDLTRLGYTTDIGAPGNTCGAAELVASTAHPSLFIWGSDYEAAAQMGDGCPAPKFSAVDVVAHSFGAVFVCVADPTLNPLSGDQKLGIWQSTEVVQTNVVKLLNSLAGSSLAPVPYDGSGGVLTALTNGEVTVGFLPPARAATLIESGGACPYSMSAADISQGSQSLVEKFNDTALELTSLDVIVAQNWDMSTLTPLVAGMYADETSSVNANTTKFTPGAPADFDAVWAARVAAFVTK